MYANILKIIQKIGESQNGMHTVTKESDYITSARKKKERNTSIKELGRKHANVNDFGNEWSL